MRRLDACGGPAGVDDWWGVGREAYGLWWRYITGPRGGVAGRAVVAAAESALKGFMDRRAGQ